MNNSSFDLTNCLGNSCDSKIKSQSLQQSDLQKSKILKKNSLKIVGLSIVINTIIAALLGYFYSISPISSKILFPVIAFSGLFMGGSGLYCLHRHIQYLNIKNSQSQESNNQTPDNNIANDSNLQNSSGHNNSDPDRFQLIGHETNGTIPLLATFQNTEPLQSLKISGSKGSLTQGNYICESSIVDNDPDRFQLIGHETNGTISLPTIVQNTEPLQSLKIPSTFVSPTPKDIKSDFKQSKIDFC